MHRIIRPWALIFLGLCGGLAQAGSPLERVQERAERLLSNHRGGPSEILYVGPGGGSCDYADLDNALAAAAPGAEIRLTTGPFTGPFIAGEKSLTLVGGFVSCGDPSPVGRTTLTGDDTSTVVTLLSADGSASFELQNLLIEDGNGSALAGGLDIRGGITVLMRNVLIRLNSTASDGGGLRVAHSSNTEGALVVLLDQTDIQNNVSSNLGGGVACLGGGGQQHVVVLDNGRIAGNNANRGGGVYAENCTFVSLAGGPGQGIDLNLAQNGGGIYATDGSQVALDGTAPGFLTPGNPEDSALLAGNRAVSDGGGVYLTGATTTFRAVDADIAANEAQDGAAIYSIEGAGVTVERGPDTDCRRFDSPGSPAPCSRIRGNVSDQFFTILVSGDGAEGRISQTFIHDNETGSSINSPLIRIYSDVGGDSSRLELEGVVIHDNDVNLVLVETWNDSFLEVLWSTVADNVLGGMSPPLFQTWTETGAAPEQRIFSGTIVYQPGLPVANSQDSQSLFFFCSIAHELGFPGQISQSIAADPEFLDAAADNYHISAESPAVDFCAEGSWPPAYPDIDGQTRGVATANPSTPFDAGADEALDRIFADRFLGNL
jgi:hypothetical protein